MRVQLAVLADCANVAAGAKLNLMGVFSTILVNKLPATNPFMVLAVRLGVDYHDGGKSHEFRIRAVDPDHRTLFEIAHSLTLPAIGAGEEQYIDQIIPFPGLRIERPGELSFRILWNGKEVAVVPLTIRQVDPK